MGLPSKVGRQKQKQKHTCDPALFFQVEKKVKIYKVREIQKKFHHSTVQQKPGNNSEAVYQWKSG